MIKYPYEPKSVRDFKDHYDENICNYVIDRILDDICEEGFMV